MVVGKFDVEKLRFHDSTSNIASVKSLELILKFIIVFQISQEVH